MPKIYDSILDTVGATPIVRLDRMQPDTADVYVKVESFNPMGSVKDRLALGVIEAAEQSGELKPGQTVIEATSGNTGIGLAMVCARKGYPLVVTMAENFSLERRRLMRFLGAKVVLTPASLKGSGMLAKATELADTHGWFLCRQFENEANANAHSETTAPEILEAFRDRPLDYWVSGFGTGGTLKGVSRVLKAARPEIQVVAAEPDNSPILGSGIAQERRADGSPADSHPLFRPHLMQGWSPDFIPKLAEDAQGDALIDQIVTVAGDDALDMSRRLAREEGIFSGISGGATLAAALKLAKTVEPGTTILCMLPDTGERYLSTPLFEDVPVDMTDEEIALSQSTPGARFDAPPPAPPVEEEAPAAATPEALKELEATVSNPDSPVVMYALEWCEFCWSVRKMMARYGIDYRSVDLDSVEYQVDERGGKLRAALRETTGQKTIPQIYIGGKHIGGATDFFDAAKDGSLSRMLEENDVPWNTEVTDDPYSFLPGWLHPR